MRSRPSTRRAPASPKDVEKSVRLLQAAALADNVDAEVEYAIALFNGTGTPKNVTAAVGLLRKAARQGNPIAQNRLAWVLVNGQGAPMDKIEGLKWHLIAKNAGRGDPELDGVLARSQSRGPRQGGRSRAQMARLQMIRLDAMPTAGHPQGARPAHGVRLPASAQIIIPVLT